MHDGWTPTSWQGRPGAQQFEYPDAEAVASACGELGRLPPLVTSWEIEQLKALIADAQEGKRLVLQGGDCAESLSDCTSESIASKLKILLQMSLVLVQGTQKPVVRIGRFAGQYAKPRSSAVETRVVDGQEVSLPSYFGDLVNHEPFTVADRTPDPMLMVSAHQHAALTLNFVRSLTGGGFADLHHPEYWDLGFVQHAGLSGERRAQYERTSRELSRALRFMEALGERSVDELSRVEFFTSHEGLNLLYESSMTRRVPRREGWYNLSTHLPWIGERTRGLDDAHVEYFRGVSNPIGVKLGPKAEPVEVLRLIDRLNPSNEPGKLVLITRMGAEHVGTRLAPLIEVLSSARKLVLWVCDPMHGNGITTANGVKTRRFDDIQSELEQAVDIHRRVGAGPIGGVHFELTGDDVTECVGGASGVTEDRLSDNYRSLCDPRLNYAQALELAFLLADRIGEPPPWSGASNGATEA